MKYTENVKAMYGSHNKQMEQTTAPVILAILTSFCRMAEGFHLCAIQAGTTTEVRTISA